MAGIVGKLASGWMTDRFDRFGSYDPLLWAGVAASLVCSALLFNLGRPPVWTVRTAGAF